MVNWLYCTVSIGVALAGLGSAYRSASMDPLFESYNNTAKIGTILEIILDSKFILVSVINFAYCLLFLVGKAVQLLCFGKLRSEESRNLWERLMNYALLKLIFVGAIQPSLQDILVLAVWFSVLGFLKILSLLSRDRLEYLFTTANLRFSAHSRIIGLLVTLLGGNILWFSLCVYFFLDTGFGVITLLTFECFVILLESMETFMKYGLHLHRCDSNWEARGVLIYFTEFMMETLILLLTLAHYGQLLFSLGVSLSIVNVVLFFNVRYVFVSLRERVYSLRNYLKLAYAMKSRYPDVSKEELEQLDDYCAICRDPMESAKKLPCNHIFHQSCLRGWLEQHHSCPTCRYSLIDSPPSAPIIAENPNVNDEANPNGGDQHVDAGNILDQHPAPNPRQEIAPNPVAWRDWFAGNGVTRNMIRAVQEVAPHIPEHIIERDLALTRSTDLTLENIFEGRLVAPEEQPILPGPQVNRPEILNRSSGGSPVHSSVEPDSELPEPPAGYAVSSADRERNLQARKLLLKQQARQKFLERKQSQETKKELPSPVLPDQETDVFYSSEPVTELVIEPENRMNDSYEMKRRRIAEAVARRENSFS